MMARRKKLLKDSLILLAAPAEAQLKHLKEIGVPENIDELALEFDDIGAAYESMFQSGELSLEQRDCVKALNKLLKAMTGKQNARLWTVDALQRSPEWREVRLAAQHCLSWLKGE